MIFDRVSGVAGKMTLGHLEQNIEFFKVPFS